MKWNRVKFVSYNQLLMISFLISSLYNIIWILTYKSDILKKNSHSIST